MKKLTAALIAIAAFSAPAFAETPATREMHSFDYVSQASNPEPMAAPMAQSSAAPAKAHHTKGHHTKGHTAHKGKTVKHTDGKKHHHHHNKDAAAKKAAAAPAPAAEAPASETSK